jgi:hypothetical protein
MKNKQQTERPAQVAELSDADLKILANYKIVKAGVIDPDPSKRYFLAAKNSDDFADRPDGVDALLQIGYIVSQKKYHGPAGLIPMEIDRRVWEAREEMRHRADARALKTAKSPQEGQFRTERD